MTVPGVSAQNRQNYAQDLQLSVRGFGARSSFGVRGVRLYSDGIPGTMPDGQGQFSQFDLSSAGHIEVLRGPFSALYGNSSGGVISIFTEDAKPGYSFGAEAEYGTFNTQRYDLKTTGDNGAVNYVVDTSHFQTNGYRVHSDAQRNLFNAKLSSRAERHLQVDDSGQRHRNPIHAGSLGADPRAIRGQSDPGRRERHRLQHAQESRPGTIGRRITRTSSAPPMNCSPLPIPDIAARSSFRPYPWRQEANPLSPGGVIDLDRAYWGVDLHMADQRSIAGTPLLLVAGLNYDDLAETRKGYLNYVGTETRRARGAAPLRNQLRVRL